VRLRACIAAVLLLAASPSRGAAVSQPVTPGAPEPFAETLVELRINDQPDTHTLIVRRDADGTLLLRAADLATLRLKPPSQGMLQVNGERFYRLGRDMGATVVFDEGTQSGQVTLPPQAFLPTKRQPRGPDTPQAERAAPGAFLNYDVFAQRDGASNQAGGFFELGLFGGRGVLTNTLLARHDDADRGATRLDTTWTRDFPDRLATLRVGDSITTPGSWGRAVRFAGVQFGTNFSTQPMLVTTPLLAAHGEALVPSTVDVFVNNRPVASEQVPPGPFTIDRLPVLTGAGQLQVVVTDALGRQQVIVQPYYSGSALLRPDLQEYAFELGSLRQDYSTRSFAYGDLLGSATWRRGLSDTLTVGARGEFQANGVFAAGTEAAWQAGRVGVLTGQLAAGGSDDGTGFLAGLGLERSGNRVNAFASTQFASRDFMQVGLGGLEKRPRDRTFAGLGFDLQQYGSVQFAYGLQGFHDASSVQTLGLSYALTLGRLGYFGLYASHAMADDAETTLLATWTMSLGERRTVSTAIQQSSGDTSVDSGLSAFATLQQDLPTDRGLGYRVSLSSDQQQDASLGYSGRAGLATLDVAQRGDSTGVRLGATGAVALTTAGLMPTRRLDQSFAVVQVADYEGLTVFRDNQPIGRTDAHGRVLVPSLRAYERNEISIDPVEVPMDGAIGARMIPVTPAYRSGTVVQFPVRRAYAATMRLVQDDGQPVPAGASATLGGAGAFPVAMNGMLYVEGLEQAARVQVSWNGGQCSVALRRPAGKDPVPDLGTVRCR
jgi:outer membrane usher protein